MATSHRVVVVVRDAEAAAERLRRDFGLRVRELREKLNITQAQAARRLPMDLDNYIRIERGRRNLTLHTIAKIALMLEIDVIKLFQPPTNRHPRPGRPRRKE